MTTGVVLAGLRASVLLLPLRTLRLVCGSGGLFLLSLLHFGLAGLCGDRAISIAIAAALATCGTTTLRGAAPAATPDLGHVPAIDADLFASFPTGRSGLVGGEFVGLALLMGCPPAFTRDFALAVGIHGGKASVLGTG